jgi:class 3 adenylate cyclase
VALGRYLLAARTRCMAGAGAGTIHSMVDPSLRAGRAPSPPSEQDLPSGTVTFLFTDVEGSTALWEQRPGAMRDALARHDDLLRAAIAAHRGRVFKTVGDAFCAAFEIGPDALGAAVAAQRALLGQPWGEGAPLRVRMALHTGAAELRDDDYFGPPLNRAARLLAAGHGGQLLLTQATYDAVGVARAAGARAG